MASSSAGKEIELKFRVDGDSQLQALATASRGRAGEPLKQVNHFFDTKDGNLNASKYTLRLRDENGRFLLTAKGPERKSADGTRSEKAEEERPVEVTVANAILSGAESPLTVLERVTSTDIPVLKAIRATIGAKPLVYVGNFKNTRTPVTALIEVKGQQRPVVFEMDRTEFPNGRVDHEVEVELKGQLGDADADAAEKAVRALLDRAGIRPESAPSKAKRFFEIALK
jgi:uncharacterized protein YjbK